MVAFIISVNGKRCCTMGTSASGLLHAAAILFVTAIVAASGCDGLHEKHESGQTATAAGWRFEHPGTFDTASELQQFVARESLGGRVNIQTRERLVFAQTFPYSGVDASHLFVYSGGAKTLAFVCFFEIPTQTDIDLTTTESGAVAIRADERLIATLPQP
jgi:hypothetical protein